MKLGKVIAILALSFVCVSNVAHSQFTSYGVDPWGQKWRQITTPRFRLIYPQQIDSIAQQYAFFLDTAYMVSSKTIGHKPIRIPITLHPDNTFSNGVVVWAPRRMELMITPPTSLYPVTWEKQLAVHEYRHVAQIDKLNQGVMRAAYYLLGEQASGLWLLPIPPWFLEGDAVATETGASSSGRGRLPEFHMPYRAYLLSGINFHYDKWMNGSFKDFIPSKYPFGYEQLSYVRYKWGSDSWDKVIDEVPRRYFKFPTFSNALKKHTGYRVEQVQRQAFDYLKEQWLEEESRMPIDTSIRYHTPSQQRFISYSSPISVNDSTLVALKVSLTEAQAVVTIGRNGVEKHLTDYGSINERPRYSNGKLYWSENLPDPRWEQRSFAVIKRLDLATRKLASLTRRSRYFSVDINGDGSKIITKTATREGANAVCVLDITNGSELARFATPENSFIKEVVWAGCDSALCLLVNDKGLGIYTLNLSNTEWSVALPESPVNITSLAYYDSYALFEAGYSEVNNIYALSMSSGQVYRITDSRFGSFEPSISIDGKAIYFTDYEAYGHRIASKLFTPSNWQAQSWDSPHRYPLADNLSEQEGRNLDTLTVPSGTLYESKPFRKALNLFQFHSWAPLYIPINNGFSFDVNEIMDEVALGFTLLSQNELSTAVSTLAYSYQNGYHVGHGTFSYMGWLPVVDLIAVYGNGRQQIFDGADVYNGSQYSYEVGIRTYLPLNFTNTSYRFFVTPSAQLQNSNNRFFVPSEDVFKNKTLLDLALQARIYAPLALSDIYPRWGFVLWGGHSHAPLDTENFGSIYAARLTTYLPGLFTSHGISLSAGIQAQEVQRYYLSSLLDFPRGYAKMPTKSLRTFSAIYVFPFAYPDFNIGPLAYIKRLRCNLFVDYGKNTYYYAADGLRRTRSVDMASFGIDIIADYNLIRLEFPFNTGLRILKPKDAGVSVEILFGVTL